MLVPELFYDTQWYTCNDKSQMCKLSQPIISKLITMCNKQIYKNICSTKLNKKYILLVSFDYDMVIVLACKDDDDYTTVFMSIDKLEKAINMIN